MGMTSDDGDLVHHMEKIPLFDKEGGVSPRLRPQTVKDSWHNLGKEILKDLNAMSKFMIEPKNKIKEELEIESPGRAERPISEDGTPDVEGFVGQSIYNLRNE